MKTESNPVKPCLIGCWTYHSAGCHNIHGYVPKPNAPGAAEVKCATCGREESWHRGSMHGFRPKPIQPPAAPIGQRKCADEGCEVQITGPDPTCSTNAPAPAAEKRAIEWAKDLEFAQRGCTGSHFGTGAPGCPADKSHHHHDSLCDDSDRNAARVLLSLAAKVTELSDAWKAERQEANDYCKENIALKQALTVANARVEDIRKCVTIGEVRQSLALPDSVFLAEAWEREKGEK